MRNSRKVLLVAAGSLLATMLWMSTALAAGAPKFHSATSSVNNDGSLVVSFDERGLGNENVDYTLTSDATALYACINRGGKNPEAANKQSFEGQVNGGGSFEPKNGRVVASLTAGPLLAPQFTCPSGQRRVLASVSYTNIVLTDTTNNVSSSVPDTSRTFLEV
jgi:hypothetical protein